MQTLHANTPFPPIDLAHEDVSYVEGRKVIHKIDRRLITATGLMFAVSLMDRTNTGSANIAGMGKQLKLNIGFRYVSLS